MPFATRVRADRYVRCQQVLLRDYQRYRFQIYTSPFTFLLFFFFFFLFLHAVVLLLGAFCPRLYTIR